MNGTRVVNRHDTTSLLISAHSNIDNPGRDKRTVYENKWTDRRGRARPTRAQLTAIDRHTLANKIVLWKVSR
jgi:hypothetical protein